MPVAIAIHAIAQQIGGEHLHLPDLPAQAPVVRAGSKSPRAVSAIPARTWLEQFGAAAIMCQCHQRVAGAEIALHRAEVGLKPQNAGEDPAECRNCAHLIEGTAIGFVLGGAVLQTIFRDYGFGEVAKAVFGKRPARDPLSGRGDPVLPREERGNGLLRKALRCGLFRHGCDETVETAAAGAASPAAPRGRNCPSEDRATRSGFKVHS